MLEGKCACGKPSYSCEKCRAILATREGTLEAIMDVVIENVTFDSAPDFVREAIKKVLLSEPCCELVALARRRNAARQKVVEWTEAEAAALRLVTNNQAPSWNEYLEAESALDKAVGEIGC